MNRSWKGSEFISGTKAYANGRRKAKEQSERERRKQAKQAQDKDQAEWVMAHMGEEIDKMRKREDNEQEKQDD